MDNEEPLKGFLSGGHHGPAAGGDKKGWLDVGGKQASSKSIRAQVRKSKDLK